MQITCTMWFMKCAKKIHTKSYFQKECKTISMGVAIVSYSDPANNSATILCMFASRMADPLSPPSEKSPGVS